MSSPSEMERDVRRYLGLTPYERSGLKGCKEFLHACVVHYGPPFSSWVERLQRHLEGKR